MTAIPSNERIKFLGASEITTVCGMNQFKTAKELFLEKTGQKPVDNLDDNPDALRGNVFEEPIRKYAMKVDKHWKSLRHINKHWIHPYIPNMTSSPDWLGRRHDVEGSILVECKTTRAYKITEERHLLWKYQLAHQQATAPKDFPNWAVVCMTGGWHYQYVHYEHDAKLVAYVEKRADKFMQSVADWLADNGGYGPFHQPTEDTDV